MLLGDSQLRFRKLEIVVIGIGDLRAQDVGEGVLRIQAQGLIDGLVNKRHPLDRVAEPHGRSGIVVQGKLRPGLRVTRVEFDGLLQYFLGLPQAWRVALPKEERALQDHRVHFRRRFLGPGDVIE